MTEPDDFLGLPRLSAKDAFDVENDLIFFGSALIFTTLDATGERTSRRVDPTTARFEFPDHGLRVVRDD